MRGFGNKRSRFAAASALCAWSMWPSIARAELVLYDANGWRFLTAGRVEGHFQLIEGDGDPVSHNRLVGGQIQNTSTQDENNKLVDSRIRSGFVGSQIDFGVSNKLTETVEAKALVAAWVGGIDSNKGTPPASKDVDVREAWGSVVGPFGTFLFGRAFSILAPLPARSTTTRSLTRSAIRVWRTRRRLPADRWAGPSTLGSTRSFSTNHRVWPDFRAAGVARGSVVAARLPHHPSSSIRGRNQLPSPVSRRRSVRRERPGARAAAREIERRPRRNGIHDRVGSHGGGSSRAGLVQAGWRRLDRQGHGHAQRSPTGRPGQAVGARPARRKLSGDELRSFRGYFGNVVFDYNGTALAVGAGGAFVQETISDAAAISTSLLRQNVEYHAVFTHRIHSIVLSAEYMHWQSKWYLSESQSLNFIGVGSTFVW